MHLRLLQLPLIAMGALAACQSSSPAPDSTWSGYGDGSDSGRPAESDPPSGNVPPPESTRRTPAEGSFGGSSARDSMPPAQDPPGATSSDPWGPGTMHLTLGGNFVRGETEGEPMDPGDDIDTLDVQATLGTFVTERIEVNAQGTYTELDVGEDDINQVGLFAGLRYHLVLPTEDSPLGIYGEGKAGVMSVDRASGDKTDFAYGASTGVIWFPWSVASGVAIDVAVNYVRADELDRLTASLALGYYW